LTISLTLPTARGLKGPPIFCQIFPHPAAGPDLGEENWLGKHAVIVFNIVSLFSHPYYLNYLTLHFLTKTAQVPDELTRSNIPKALLWFYTQRSASLTPFFSGFSGVMQLKSESFSVEDGELFS